MEEGIHSVLGVADSCPSALQERYEKEVAWQAENRGGGTGDASMEPSLAGQAESETRTPESSASQQRLSEVELKWQTEREEKRLLKEQLQSLEVRDQCVLASVWAWQAQHLTGCSKGLLLRYSP